MLCERCRLIRIERGQILGEVILCEDCYADLRERADLGDRLVTTCKSWIDEHQPSCPESVYQTDRCVINAPQLVEAICNTVGFYNHPDDEEE